MATRPSSAKRNGALDPALPQKKRARRRLIGAAAVSLLAAVLLPAVFDSEPRQSRDAIDVHIPARDTPLKDPVGVSSATPSTPGRLEVAPSDGRQPAAQASAESAGTDGSTSSGVAGQKAVPRAGQSGEARAGQVAAAASEPTKDAKPAPAAEPRTKTRVDTKPDAREASQVDPIAKLVEASQARPAPGAYQLQVGAFASEKTANEQAALLRKAGQRAHTEKVRTAQGERIRVRAGPFPTREAAERVRTKLKAAGIDTVLVAP